MSDETTRARLLTIGSLEWALNLPKCADDDVSRVIAYRKEIEAQCTQAAAHAETVARLEQRAAMAEMMLAQKQQLTRGIDRALRAAGFNYGENVTIRDGETIAAALIDRLAAERDALEQAVAELSREYHAAIHEQEYAGTRADWIYRAQAAEAQVAAITAENANLKADLDASKVWNSELVEQLSEARWNLLP